MFGAVNLVRGLAQPQSLLRKRKHIDVLGEAQLTSESSQFQGISIQIESEGDGLSIPGRGDFVFESDFCIEFWTRLLYSDTGSQMLITNRLTGQYNSNDFFVQWAAELEKLQWGIKGYTPQLTSNRQRYDQWYHIALVRHNNQVQMYVDGQAEGAALTITDTVGTDIIRVGLLGTGNSNRLVGNVDELRISDVARYQANFTPATEPFQNDESTLLLIHGEGVAGSQEIRDDNSGE
jgi:hypothetical protein